MTIYSNKKNCCGCTACVSICPQKCIIMKSDEEGFSYPVVDTTSCIGCGACEKICPVIRYKNEQKNSQNYNADKVRFTHEVVRRCSNKPDSYVAYIKDDLTREDSTSGGFFSAVANYVLSVGGVVIGAEFDEDFNVVHRVEDDEQGVGNFRGSKYVQSSQIGIYSKVKELLQNDRWVLYTGTPCQAAGLKAYLHKEYEKLIVIDVFCHGVGSPLYWREYLKYVESRRRGKVKNVRFREKTYGYNSACLALYFSDGTCSKKAHDEDYYWHAFSKCMIFRPSCYDCAFKTIEHSFSDFSIGDYWNCNTLGQKYKKANGCSLVIVQSPKGKGLLKKIESAVQFTKVDLEEALLVNGGWQTSKLISSSMMPPERKSIFKCLRKRGFSCTAKRYTPIVFKTRIKALLKPVLYKTGLLNRLK